jgi:23S rRNA (adenine2503-C2)-methyltransferase
MPDITALTFEDLKNDLEKWGLPSFHAQQIFSWIYKRGIIDFDKMSDLSVSLRGRLKENFSICDLGLAEIQESQDATKKFLFKLNDANFIEAVTIPAQKRLTGCISTQAGCKFACCFCASGLAGFKRNLDTAEIINQLLYLKNNSRQQLLTHVVFMGTGEPLDNYDNVLKAVRIINAKEGFSIGARRITISTCGIIPGIEKLMQEGLQIELSVSLHSADDKTRSQLMPVNKTYPLQELISACRQYAEKTKRQVTFEYVMIKDLNSRLPDAFKLCTILKGFDCKVNLIPFNALKKGSLVPPNKMDILIFRDRLLKSGIKVTLRKSRGEDIEAACGQLRLRYEKA